MAATSTGSNSGITSTFTSYERSAWPAITFSMVVSSRSSSGWPAARTLLSSSAFWLLSFRAS